MPRKRPTRWQDRNSPAVINLHQSVYTTTTADGATHTEPTLTRAKAHQPDAEWRT